MQLAEMPLTDSLYDNELLMCIADESPTFANLVRSMKQDMCELDQGAVWLGSFVDDVPAHTQVQLLVTQAPEQQIDED